jgi:hypothetical protein
MSKDAVSRSHRRREEGATEVDAMERVIELYEDENSAWRVLTDQLGTTGYRFNIVERAIRTSFPADARQLAVGKVPSGLEVVDLSPGAPHGMELSGPCALWIHGEVERTSEATGVLTQAYITAQPLNGRVRRRRAPA